MKAKPSPHATSVASMIELPQPLRALAAYRQFIVYQLVPDTARPGKTFKYPLDWRTGKRADAHDPAIWLDHTMAAATAAAFGSSYGAGFVLTAADPFWFIDIDECLLPDASDWTPEALALLARFPGAAVEVSQSGRGLHILGRGRAPEPRRKKGPGFDLYTERRFVALTGTGALGDVGTDHTPALVQLVADFLQPEPGAIPSEWTDGPCEAWRGPEDDHALLKLALRSVSGASSFGGKASFSDLWTADVDALARAFPDDHGLGGYDESRADAALAQHLAFWTGKDCERIRVLMERSALNRDKWRRDDYLPRTISGAVGRQRDVLGDKPPPSDASLGAAAITGGEASGRSPKQADILLDIAQSAELFHAPDGTGYADVHIKGHHETWPIRSKGFKHWLMRGFFNATQGAPNSDALQSALGVIEARAHFDSPEHIVHIRVAELSGRLYLDLGDETWRVVEIDAAGWRVIDKPPIRFRRTPAMKSLPIPVGGGSIASLRPFLNVQSEQDFVLVVAWVLAALRSHGPYPVIVLSGEQGSAKSTFSEIVRALIDPNVAPLRALPREDRDLFIAANNGHVLAFDNVSGLPTWISDTLCRLASGGGFATRTLYSDQDETIFDAARPMILNGIEDIVTRPDLADRALILTLEPIPEDQRQTKDELWAAFESERPRILGVLLDAVAEGIRCLPTTRLTKLPRMADFAKWVTACETMLWPAGTFETAYCGNRNDAVERVLDADPIAAAVRTLMAKESIWTGTASDLLIALVGVADPNVVTSKTWPHNPNVLSGRLRRAGSFLRATGVNINFRKEGRTRTRTIHITTSPN
ncbi:MAG: hypothetical protein P4L72_12005 [Parvibaculum sp.]|uniref:phage NrS-1 polymerase family protein n=1 Tax=Parvibaculum sp. TaxID=2024848 RepID=UPI00283F3551|nr:hypothetical protein [Parvibaculum sp.]MDR3499935.1 hypothetical protein [Parvibaculum sp.]